MVLLIDNYDSFSYNLYQLIGEIDTDITTVRNDEITIDQIIELDPDAIVLSPGPGKPENAGICIRVVQQLKGRFPILGVCLGHQAICCAYGATVDHAPSLMHGKRSDAELSSSPLFEGIASPLKVGRYHSLAVVESTLPCELEVTSRVVGTNEVMSVQDKKNKVWGLQFHPESILTESGKVIMSNFLKGE